MSKNTRQRVFTCNLTKDSLKWIADYQKKNEVISRSEFVRNAAMYFLEHKRDLIYREVKQKEAYKIITIAFPFTLYRLCKAQADLKYVDFSPFVRWMISEYIPHWEMLMGYQDEIIEKDLDICIDMDGVVTVPDLGSFRIVDKSTLF